MRSKSELVIADALFRMDIDYQYEKEYVSLTGWKTRPDFSFVDAAGELIVWEHLGLLHEQRYSDDWKRKSKDYLATVLSKARTSSRRVMTNAGASMREISKRPPTRSNRSCLDLHCGSEGVD